MELQVPSTPLSLFLFYITNDDDDDDVGCSTKGY